MIRREPKMTTNGSPPIALSQIRIAAPCSADWNAMQGDDQVRHCRQCNKHVYNLVGMSNEEATALLIEHEGQACIRGYQRTDGTLMTQNCPVGLRRLRQRMAWGMGSLATGFAVLLSSVTFGLSGRFGARVKRFEPFARLSRLVQPAPAPAFFGRGMVMGAVAPTSFPPAIMTPAQAKARRKRIQQIFKNSTPVDPIYKDKDGNFKLEYPSATAEWEIPEYPMPFNEERP